MATPSAKPITKTQHVATLAEEMGSDKKSATAALDAIAAVVSREVAAGGSVTIIRVEVKAEAHITAKARPISNARRSMDQAFLAGDAKRLAEHRRGVKT